MYAIVEIAGTQVKVEKDKYYYTPLLEGNEGDKVEFDNVLLVDNDGKVNVGAPSINGSKVIGKILGHQKGDKVVVFKKKRRKGYKKKNGHRQEFTKVQISDILLSASKASTSKKGETLAPKKSAKSQSQDDLSKIKGIGPVFQEELNKIGYTTFNQIAKLTVKECESIAEKIDGVSVDLIKSEEWIKQAKATDLTQIKGIGPVFKEELHKLGYYNIGQIAELTTEDIESIAEKIDGISTDLVKSEEWIEQAKKLNK